MATIIIPQDIITNHILGHLPSKSVGRFRCVSKEWLSLLTDPQFIKTHVKTLNTDPHINTLTKSCIVFESTEDGFLYSVPYNNLEAVSPLTLKDGSVYSIDGSVNGLVLASAYYKGNNSYIILNPTTKDYMELPCSEQFVGLTEFGYDSVSGDYKLVVFCTHENYNHDVYVYNLTTNTMKLVMSRAPYQVYRFDMSPGVFINGFLYWIFLDLSEQELVIVAFSLADEKLSELPLPSGVDMSDSDNKLVALGEKLAIFHQLKGDLWLMNDYGVLKSWTKIVVLGFNETQMYKPMVFYDCGKVVFLTRDQLRMYDIDEQTFCKCVDLSYMKIRHVMGSYAESLISPRFNRSI